MEVLDVAQMRGQIVKDRALLDQCKDRPDRREGCVSLKANDG